MLNSNAKLSCTRNWREEIQLAWLKNSGRYCWWMWENPLILHLQLANSVSSMLKNIIQTRRKTMWMNLQLFQNHQGWRYICSPSNELLLIIIPGRRRSTYWISGRHGSNTNPAQIGNPARITSRPREWCCYRLSRWMGQLADCTTVAYPETSITNRGGRVS